MEPLVCPTRDPSAALALELPHQPPEDSPHQPPEDSPHQPPEDSPQQPPEDLPHQTGGSGAKELPHKP